MNFSSIKFKVIISIILSLAIGSAAIIYLFNVSYQKNIQLISEQAVQMSAESFNNLEKNDTNMLSATLETLLKNDNFKKYFLAQDRDNLYKEAAPLFKNFKERYRITHWYFLNAEPDSTCFLRVHKPEQFGDVIKRATYLKSVEKKDFAAGKELGKTAFALRVVHPYYDNGKLIGYMELGEEIDHFLDIMKKQTGNEYGLLVKKQYLDEKEWSTMVSSKGEKNHWNDYKDVVLVNKTNNDNSIINFEGDIEKIPEGGAVLEEVKKGDNVFVRGIFPIYDAKDRKVGGVFLLRDITPIYNDMKAMQNKVIMFIIALMIILSVLIILMFNSLVIKRLTNMIETATRVVGGDYKTEIVQSANDEIGQFEYLFEQFRTVFVSLACTLEEDNKKK